jgi:hypothetical protein
VAATLAPLVFLLDYPYNREGVALPAHCLRVSGWDEILSHLRTEADSPQKRGG